MKFSKQFVLAILLFSLITIDKSVAFDANVSEKARALMQDFQENSNSPGLAVSVGHHGTIAWSGVRHYQGSEFFGRDHYASVNEGLVIFQDDPLVHEPGSAYLYSSYGYNLLGAVIEGASGQSYLDFMASRVFVPMEMNTTVPDYLSQIISGRGRYYYEQDGQVINAPEADNSYKWPSGGVIGTSDDLVRFGHALLNDEFFDATSREAFWTMQHTASGEETGYGLGFRIAIDENGTRWIGHGGGSVGGTTQFWISPEDGLVIAMISNLSNFNFETVLVSLAEIFTGQSSAE